MREGPFDSDYVKGPPKPIRPLLVVRYAGWWDRLCARFPGSKNRRTLLVTQTILEDIEPEVRERAYEQARDLALYGSTYVDAAGRRIPPEAVRVFPPS